MLLKEIKRYEVSLSVENHGVTNTFIALQPPFVNGDGFVEIQLENGSQLYDRPRVIAMVVKLITE
ncbi:hypothetical protein [Citrobacter gillenii]|uniref:hypothetical protein n=1 Tax=Citrobacter gillenii TaxID=67828 RepID=UPI0039877BEB